jgi:hypothetical protein
MNYYVARGGQTYGPYNEETIRKYLAEGSMQATDMARTETMQTWTPLGQLLGSPAYGSAPVYGAPNPVAPPPAYGRPAGAMGNVPPQLHWALVLLIAAFTSGLFITIWAFIQANWIKTIDPTSRAIRDLAIGVVAPIAGGIIMILGFVTAGVSGGFSDGHEAALAVPIVITGLIFSVLAIAGMVFTLMAFFSMRSSLERYYNTVEPINLRLSAVMTFFFNVIYFQYHLTRISDWKMTGVLRP